MTQDTLMPPQNFLQLKPMELILFFITGNSQVSSSVSITDYTNTQNVLYITDNVNTNITTIGKLLFKVAECLYCTIINLIHS